jgi:transposase
MSSLNEQRVCVKFCFKLGQTFTEASEMLQKVFGDETMSRTTTYQWYRRFEDGRTSIEGDPRSGRPSSTDDDSIEQVRAVIRSDRRLTVQEVAYECGISVWSRHTVLTEKLNMHRVAAKSVLQLLTDEQKEQRVAISQEFLHRANDEDTFLKRHCDGNESWVYEYNVETKRRFSQWISKSRRTKKSPQVRPNVKALLIIFIDYEGAVHYEFVPEGHTVKEFYLEDLRR